MAPTFYRVRIGPIPGAVQRRKLIGMLRDTRLDTGIADLEARIAHSPVHLGRTPNLAKARRLCELFERHGIEAVCETIEPPSSARAQSATPQPAAPKPAATSSTIHTQAPKPAVRPGFLAFIGLIVVAFGAVALLFDLPAKWQQILAPQAQACVDCGNDTGALTSTAPRDGQSPAQLRTLWRATYRPGPDARFLAAQEYLRRLSGKAPHAPTVTLEDDHWRIERPGDVPGTLPRFSSFLQAWEWLARSYTGAARTGPALDRATAQKLASWQAHYWVPSQLRILEALTVEGRLALGTPDRALLAASAAVNIALQTANLTEASDDLLGHALALTVTARHAGADTNELQALLAWRLGYEADALSLAEGLLSSHPSRLLALQDTDSLMAVAKGTDADNRTRHLALIAASSELPLGAWRSLAHELLSGVRYGPALHAAALWGGAFYFYQSSSACLSLATIDAVDGSRDRHFPDCQAPSEADGTWVQAYQAARQRQWPDEPPPLSAAALALAHYDANFWSGVYARGHYLLEELSSLRDAKAFIAQLDGGGERARLAREWLLHLINNREGRLRAPAMAEAFPALDGLPWSYRQDYFLALWRSASYGIPELRVAFRRLAESADERPAHLASVAFYRSRVLLDQQRAITYYEAALRAAPRTYADKEAWIARHNLDVAALRSLMTDLSRTPDLRSLAFDYLEELGEAEPSEAIAFFKELTTQDPDDYAVLQRTVDYLEDNQRHADAMAFLNAWLERNDHNSSLDWLSAQALKADLLRRTGRSQDAWKLTAPLVSSAKGDVMHQAAEAALALGRHDEALEIADAAYRRYPDNVTTMMNKTTLLWRLGRFDEGIAVMKAHRPALSINDWNWYIAPAFNEAFGEFPSTAAHRAVEALLAASFNPHHLEQLAIGIDDKGRNPETAFRLASQLDASGTAGIKLLMNTYDMAVRARGREEALAWLQGRLPAALRNRASMFMFSEGHDGLLWDLLTEPAPNDHPEAVWLMRAASAVRTGLADHPHREELLAYYREPRSDRVHPIGRFLMDLDDGGALMKTSVSSDRLCENAFYLGIKAEADGDLTDAAAWFQTAAETLRYREAEYRWALDRLHDYQQGKVRL